MLDLAACDIAPSLPPHARPRWTDGVAGYIDAGATAGNAHDFASREQLLARIADHLGVPKLPAVTAPDRPGGRLLLVPGETLVATAPGLGGDGEVLGGIVPARFVGTKAIAHGLVDADAARPAAWSGAMAAALGGSVLAGYTAFTVADAARAGRRLLARGPVRIKDVCGKAGLGQQVVRDVAALDRALAGEDPAPIAECGIVLEENLADVVTYSVGTVQLGGESIAYWGGQNLTVDHLGREVYGGSDLVAVRGGLAALEALDLPAALARAVACAAAFDRAAHAAYPEIRLSRRNYDVIAGTDHAGAHRIAVLEQSWRVGGASGAEVAAFEALRAEPDTSVVRCSTFEFYDLVVPPAGAVVYFSGEDPRIGAMTKYAMRLA